MNFYIRIGNMAYGIDFPSWYLNGYNLSIIRWRGEWNWLFFVVRDIESEEIK
jgi:hypothetical protein